MKNPISRMHGPAGFAKRPIAMALVSLFIFGALLSGCGQKAAPAATAPQPTATASTTPTIDQIKKAGVLTIGTSPDYPPFESLDPQNNVVGFDIDLMNEVAKALGVKLNIVQMGFDGLIAALQAKKFDIMAAGVSVTPERAQVVDFTDPYLIGKDALVVNKDWTKPISGLEDLAGATVAVQIGTVQADAAKKVAGVKVKEYNLFTEAATAVASKQADAVYLNEAVGKAFVNANPNLKIAAELPAKDTAFALRKDTPDLTAFVNQVLAQMKQDGRFDTLVAKWFK